jgi:hypothetical protein
VEHAVALERGRDLEAEATAELEHVGILGQHVAEDLGDPAAGGVVEHALHQQPASASTTTMANSARSTIFPASRAGRPNSDL